MRVKRMRSSGKKITRALASATVVALFLCQVVGSFCAMVPSIVVAVSSLVVAASSLCQAQTGHVMNGSSLCADSLPSVSKTGVVPVQRPLSLNAGDPLGLAVVVADRSVPVSAVMASARSGPPLQSFLSVFRL